MVEDYMANVVPLLSLYPKRFPAAEAMSLRRFMVAASWVASRAFGVDRSHGMSLVPLADIFNHKAAVLDLSDEYVVVGMHGSDEDSDDGSRAGCCSASEEEEEEEDHGDAEGGAVFGELSDGARACGC
jgi:hypothetical protein